MITREELEDLGFENWQERDDKYDVDGLWTNKHGITIHEGWKGESFSFATRTREDGSFKAGYNIESKQHLENIVKAITNNAV